MNKETFLSILLILCFAVSAFAQDPPDKKDRVVGKVTVAATKANVDPAYVQQRKQSKNVFVMSVPIYVDFGKSWIPLGAATIVGNNSLDLGNINLPQTPKRVAICALNDVLATKIENVER